MKRRSINVSLYVFYVCLKFTPTVVNWFWKFFLRSKAYSAELVPLSPYQYLTMRSVHPKIYWNFQILYYIVITYTIILCCRLFFYLKLVQYLHKVVFISRWCANDERYNSLMIRIWRIILSISYVPISLLMFEVNKKPDKYVSKRGSAILRSIVNMFYCFVLLS